MDKSGWYQINSIKKNLFYYKKIFNKKKWLKKPAGI